MRYLIPIKQVAAKKILLATDFSAASAAAFRASLLLCHQFGASLYVLHVFEHADGASHESDGLLIDSDISYKDAKVSVDLLIDEARRAGVACEGTVVIGRAPDTILDVLELQSCDLVLLGTRAIHGCRHLIFGSTAEAVIRSARRPVLTLGPQASSRPLFNEQRAGVVLFATDFEVVTAEAIRFAALFAKTMEVPLHCLHVLPRVLEGGVPRPHLSSVIRAALKYLADGLDLGSLPPAHAIAYGSEVSNAVVEYARSHHAKLIVLGLRRDSLAASQVPTHIAYRVITEAPCPVLTMAFPLEPKASKTLDSETRPLEATPNPVIAA